MSLDENKVNVVLRTDLSKAFGCLPHRLLISKLKAYGLNNDACSLISSYFRNRKQRVKLVKTKVTGSIFLKVPHKALYLVHLLIMYSQMIC